MKTTALTQMFSNGEKLLTAYNPSLLVRYVGDVQRCYFGTAPTFQEIQETYGVCYVEAWWIAQLADINKTSGAKEKMTSEQMRFTAKVMARKASHLKVTEAMLFLYRLRTQEYEKFYGAVDPDVIFASLKTFERERADAYRRKERSDEQRKLLSSMSAPCSRDEAVGTEEYMRGYRYAEEKEARLVRI